MRFKVLQTLAISALAATAFAQQQSTAAPTPTTAPEQTQSAKPATPPADPTATTSPTTAPPAQNTQDKSVTPDKQQSEKSKPTAQQQPAQQPAQQNDQQSKLPQSDASPVAPLDTGGMSSAELQARIESALHNEPTLTGDTLTVNVTDDQINVSGTVGSGKERTTASRIVQSFGENRKVKEKINVSGVKK